MKAYQLASGGANISAREYDIAPTTAITAGMLVKLAAGLVIPCVAAETGAILGIAAENHSGEADALDPRANGKKIMVYDAPELIFTCPVFKITATGGSATTVTANTLGAYSADDFNGGYIKLVEKAAASTNTDPVGIIKRIEDYAYNSSGTVSTFTVASGGAANSGDKFELYPPIGLAKFNLNTGRDALVNTAVNGTSVKVVGRDEDMGLIMCMIAKHALGNDQ